MAPIYKVQYKSILAVDAGSSYSKTLYGTGLPTEDDLQAYQRDDLHTGGAPRTRSVYLALLLCTGALKTEIEDSAARSAGVAVAAGSLGAQSAGGIPFLGRAERAAQESAKAPKCRSMVLSAFTHWGP
jgi:hypothetical protein